MTLILAVTASLIDNKCNKLHPAHTTEPWKETMCNNVAVCNVMKIQIVEEMFSVAECFGLDSVVSYVSLYTFLG